MFSEEIPPVVIPVNNGEGFGYDPHPINLYIIIQLWD